MAMLVAVIMPRITVENGPTFNVRRYCSCKFNPGLCEPRNLIFVHIPKTGGESIEAMLHLNKSHAYGFQRIKGYKRDKIPFVFSIIRNPYDRILSWFRFCIHGFRGYLPTPHEVCLPALRLFRQVSWQMTENDAQDAFCWRWMKLMAESTCLEGKMSCLKHPWFGPYWHYVFNPTDGRLIPDFILRFEHYAADAAALSGCLGVTSALRHKNRSGMKRADNQGNPLDVNEMNLNLSNSVEMNNFEFLASMAASKIYTKPSQEWVATNYAIDFASFGYSLEL